MRGFFWGGLPLPWRMTNAHFAAVGSTRCGKTQLLLMLMQTALWQVKAGSGHRAIIFDPKRDIVRALHGMGLSEVVRILNPFDTRSFSWDIQEDVLCDTDAQTIATTLIPDKEGRRDDFFSRYSTRHAAGRAH